MSKRTRILIFKIQIIYTLSERKSDNSNFLILNFKFFIHIYRKRRLIIIISNLKFFILILSELKRMLIFNFKFITLFLNERTLILIMYFQILYTIPEWSKSDSNFPISILNTFFLWRRMISLIFTIFIVKNFHTLSGWTNANSKFQILYLKFFTLFVNERTLIVIFGIQIWNILNSS